MTARLVRSALLPAVSALFISLVAYAPVIASGHITRDSGVFLYTGMVVSRGGMPYVDSWDHKGPLLALIEMVAWRIGGGIVGAPGVEACVLFVGLSCAGVIWARWIGNWAALVVLTVGLTYLSAYEGGNFTETWLFPFQLVAYSLAADLALRAGRDASARSSGLLGAVVGLALTVGLFTRMNNVVGLGFLALAALLLLRRRVVFAAALAATVGSIGLGLVLWLWAGNALRAAVDQYVNYNVFYSSGAPLGERVAAFSTLAQLLLSGAVVAVTLVVVGIWVATRRKTHAQHVTVLFFLMLGGVDAMSQMVSGRPYPHYLVIAIAGFAVALTAAASHVLLVARERRPGHSGQRFAAIGAVAATVLFCFVSSSSAAGAVRGFDTTTSSGVFVTGSYQARIADRVRAETTPDDRVLVHGAETWILASTQRLSPTPITYSLPVEQGYGGLPGQYIAAVMSFPPVLIVESPVSCGISTECPPEKSHFGGLAPWVASNYQLEGDIEGFRFWRRVSS